MKGNPDSLTEWTLCVKGLASIEDVYDPDRILYQLKRKGRRRGCEWKRISWDEALDTIAQKMKEIIDRYGLSSIAVLQGTGCGYNLLWGSLEVSLPPRKT